VTSPVVPNPCTSTPVVGLLFVVLASRSLPSVLVAPLTSDTHTRSKLAWD